MRTLGMFLESERPFCGVLVRQNLLFQAYIKKTPISHNATWGVDRRRWELKKWEVLFTRASKRGRALLGAGGSCWAPVPMSKIQFK